MSEVMENRLLREEVAEARTVARELFLWLRAHEDRDCRSWNGLVDSLPDWIRTDG